MKRSFRKKKTLTLMVSAAAMAVLLTGCGKPRIPKDWYEATLDYYREGFSSGWKNERDDLFIQEDLKKGSGDYGYLLRDLDGDGANEVLIGFNDGSDATKFCDVYIWHRDFGAMRVFTCGEGYYMYLCNDNVLRMDSWRGSETEIRYMVYDSGDNSWPIVDGGSEPLKLDLTEF
ncbi:MAG: hypothetical protein IKI75_06715 [Lachnospiraceae bacterium]|nr:hypothetical protein [Lachnospiraceae bacterium]